MNAAWEGIEGAIEGDGSEGGGEKKGNQDWLKELIKQEEEDREIRASVEVLRESDEMAGTVHTDHALQNIHIL